VLVLAHVREVGAAVIVAIVERIVVLWGHEPINLDELLAEDDAERLAAAQITTAAQLEPVGVARRSLGEIATGTTQRDNPTQTCHISITTG